MKNRLTILFLALLAPLLVATPAHADDEPNPAPQTPLEQCQAERAALQHDVAWWEGQAHSFEQLYLSYLDAHERMAGLAEQWQVRAFDQAKVIERQRQRIDRLSAERDRLRDKVAALRERGGGRP